MSKKAPQKDPSLQPKKQRRTDARIHRTHERLGRALMELIREKPIDAISVQEVLDRAAVGRSTFYLHFRDKNDLLLSQLEMFLETMSTMLSVRQEASDRVAPVTEMFVHVGAQEQAYRGIAESGVLEDFFALAQGYFERGIERRLRDSKRTAGISNPELRVRSVALSGSLLALFRWWMEHGAKEPPPKMDKLFHRMVWNGMQQK
jgi:AcrR family transcriptional regulator